MRVRDAVRYSFEMEEDGAMIGRRARNVLTTGFGAGCDAAACAKVGTR